MKLALFALLALLVACSDRSTPEPRRETDRQRRVIEPPPRGVRALPPYTIRADGIGPYKLGMTVQALLQQLPSGPRITQFAIPGIVQRDILRAEDDAILIGAEPQGNATFVGVVRPEIARTESGVHVGSKREELDQALGPPLRDPDRALDPRVVIPSKLENARVVLEGDRVAAIVVVALPQRAKDGAPGDSACTRPEGDRDKRLFGACLSASGELVRFGPDELALVARDGDKPITRVPVPGLVFAAALRNPNDGRDDIVAISHDDDSQVRTWSLTAYRLHEGKLVPVIPPTVVYRVTAANARWIGAELPDLELMLELTSRADAIDVSGLLTTRIGDKIRDIVVISPAQAGRRRAKPAIQETPDAGTSDARASARADE